MDIQALKEQAKTVLKELDEKIALLQSELKELLELRAELSGRDKIVPIERPKDSWTPEQQRMLAMEQEKIRSMQRFNQNMAIPHQNVQKHEVQVPPGVKVSDIIPKEMSEWLTPEVAPHD
jgi:hypothetical protein